MKRFSIIDLDSFKRERILQNKVSNKLFLQVAASLTQFEHVFLYRISSVSEQSLYLARAGSLLRHNTETMAAAFLNVSTYIPD